MALTLAAPRAGLAAQARPARVLVVGNSLTAANNLPALLMTVARLAGDTLHAEAVAGPNMALIDHLAPPAMAVQALARGPWDFVILQQGPTTLAVCRDTLILAVRQFDRLIAQAGARTALLAVWQALPGMTNLSGSTDSYRAAADAVHGLFLPVGEAWQSSAELLPALYAEDRYHPSLVGSYLAAITIYERLSGRSLLPLAARPGPEDLRRLGADLWPRLVRIGHRANLAAADTATRVPGPGIPTRPADGRC